MGQPNVPVLYIVELYCTVQYSQPFCTWPKKFVIFAVATALVFCDAFFCFSGKRRFKFGRRGSPCVALKSALELDMG